MPASCSSQAVSRPWLRGRVSETFRHAPAGRPRARHTPGASAVPQAAVASQPALQWVIRFTGRCARSAPAPRCRARPWRRWRRLAAASSSAMARLRPGGGAALRHRQRLQERLHARQRPMQVHRRRPRRASVSQACCSAFVAGAFLQRQRHAVGGGDADQRRAAHQHGADGVGGVGEGAQVPRGVLVRQQRLVEDD
jgi:hypothetical protein